jgi:hypothetical protein
VVSEPSQQPSFSRTRLHVYFIKERPRYRTKFLTHNNTNRKKNTRTRKATKETPETAGEKPVAG